MSRIKAPKQVTPEVCPESGSEAPLVLKKVAQNDNDAVEKSDFAVAINAIEKFRKEFGLIAGALLFYICIKSTVAPKRPKGSYMIGVAGILSAVAAVIVRYCIW